MFVCDTTVVAVTFANMQELKQTMAGLLRLHMSLQNEAQGDEQVTGGAGSSITQCAATLLITARSSLA